MNLSESMNIIIHAIQAIKDNNRYSTFLQIFYKFLKIVFLSFKITFLIVCYWTWVNSIVSKYLFFQVNLYLSRKNMIFLRLFADKSKYCFVLGGIFFGYYQCRWFILTATNAKLSEKARVKRLGFVCVCVDYNTRLPCQLASIRIIIL